MPNRGFTRNAQRRVARRRPAWHPATVSLTGPASVLSELASRLGVPPPNYDPSLGTGVEGPLLAADDPRVAEALRVLLGAAIPRDPGATWAPLVASALTTWLGVNGRVVLGRDAPTLLAAALADARARLRRDTVLNLEPSAQRAADALPMERADALARLAKGDVAAIVLEPRVETAADAADLAAVVAGARAGGTLVIADETRTAGRLHAGSSARALHLDVDAILLGSSLACGEAFAALIELRPPSSLNADAPPTPLALALARASALVLAQHPVAAELQAMGEALARAFGTSCARERIVAELIGPPALARFSIAPQEGVATPVLHSHVGVELERVGAQASVWCVPHALWSRQAGELARALDAAIRRLRTLLIENSSYISGGLPFVFATDLDAVRQRGLGIYRYPKLGPVDVTAASSRVRIAFAKGPLGEIVSSGFFVPTRITGDFDVEADYELLAWSSGPDSACFGLFFQNELSTGRYYAQRTIDRDGDRVLGGFDGVLTKAQTVRPRAGTFRLARVGSVVTAWHRAAGGAWYELGHTATATSDDGILGAKIWSKVECDGLVAEVAALRLRVTLAATQSQLLPVRPDPRRL